MVVKVPVVAGLGISLDAAKAFQIVREYQRIPHQDVLVPVLVLFVLIQIFHISLIQWTDPLEIRRKWQTSSHSSIEERVLELGRFRGEKTASVQITGKFYWTIALNALINSRNFWEREIYSKKHVFNFIFRLLSFVPTFIYVSMYDSFWLIICEICKLQTL